MGASSDEKTFLLPGSDSKDKHNTTHSQVLNEDARRFLALIVVFGTDSITIEMAEKMDSTIIPEEVAIQRLASHCSDPRAVLIDLADNNWLDMQKGGAYAGNP